MCGAAVPSSPPSVGWCCLLLDAFFHVFLICFALRCCSFSFFFWLLSGGAHLWAQKSTFHNKKIPISNKLLALNFHTLKQFPLCFLRFYLFFPVWAWCGLSLLPLFHCFCCSRDLFVFHFFISSNFFCEEEGGVQNIQVFTSNLQLKHLFFCDS